MKITDVRALQILDSRGTPTIEVRLTAESGKTATYSVPAGASKGENEAMELRDGDALYHGQGVQNAIELINSQLKPEIMRRNFSDQKHFDDWLQTVDPSPQKIELGGNTTLALSGAFAHLAALEQKLALSSAPDICIFGSFKNTEKKKSPCVPCAGPSWQKHCSESRLPLFTLSGTSES